MKRRPLLLLLLVLAGCSTQRTNQPQTTSVAEFRAIVADLSAPEMEGRGIGTAGLDAARDYLIRRFQQIGLAPPVKAVWGRPGSQHWGFGQEFEVDIGVRVREQALAIATDGREQTLNAGTDFNALGLSGNGKFGGGAVFVGYGIADEKHQYDSFRGADAKNLRGKVFLAFRYEPMDVDGSSLWAAGSDSPHYGLWTEAASLEKKARWAAERGAAALLLVNPPARDRGEALHATAATSGGAPGSAAGETAIPVMHISSAAFRRMLSAAGADADRATAEYQRGADRGDGPVSARDGVDPLPITLRGHAELERPKDAVANVVGLLPGSGELADEIVVVGAHYDHLGYGELSSLAPRDQIGRVIHPGADDNASGVAAMLMLADQLIRHDRETASVNRRTVLFAAFTGEERGLLGSTHMLAHLDELGLQRERIYAMVNLDMVGRLSNNRLLVMGTSSARPWREMVERANGGTRMSLAFDSSVPGASDQVSFYVQRIPAIALFTGVHADYHRPSDTAEKINADGGAKIVRFLSDLVLALRTTSAALRYTGERVDPHMRRGPSFGGGGAALGVVPDYATLQGGDGCGITGVVPGGAAEAAGLRAGDVLVRWDGKPVRNVYDLTEHLAVSRPGEEVTLRVRRGREEVELTATLQQR